MKGNEIEARLKGGQLRGHLLLQPPEGDKPGREHGNGSIALQGCCSEKRVMRDTLEALDVVGII